MCIRDSSRAVGVVRTLLNDQKQDEFIAQTRKDYMQIRESYVSRKKKRSLLSLNIARKRKLIIDWDEYSPLEPNFQGIKVFDDYPWLN